MPKPPAILGNRRVQFERFGKTYHLKIETHEDLAAVLGLDEAHWVATTAPLDTINCDLQALDLMDSDRDGRLRAEEVKDAIRFLFAHLADRSGIVPGNTRLELAAIESGSEVGRRIRESALKILRRQAADQDFVTLEQVRAIQTEVREGGLDQAGIVLPEAAEEDGVRRFIEAILATVGGKTHPGGTQGVDAACLARFLDEGRLYLAWLNRAAPDGGSGQSPILPLGEATAEAYDLFRQLKNKITQYFLLCSIQELNPQLLVRALSAEDGTLAIDILDLSAAESYLADAPLAAPNADKVLDLSGQGNPYYSRQIKRFAQIVAAPILGRTVQHLEPGTWAKIKECFVPHGEWLAAKPDVAVAAVAPFDLRRFVEDPRYEQALLDLIERSYQTAFVLENIRELERLILYQAYILPFTNSFVSFPHLYDPDCRAMFEMGTLVMDGRHFNLAVKVPDRELHMQSSKDSNIFVMYLEIYGPDGEKTHEVAVPITSGNRGNIRLNKWGIFNDIHGREWHAKVVQIIENPISVSEAMVMPFVRLAQSFMRRLEEFSAKAEEKLGFTPPAKGEKKKKEKKKEKESDLPSAGLLAGGGVAIAALGSSMAFIAHTMSKLSPKVVAGSILAVILLLVVPASISAYYKLAKRDLSAILEGSGWGVNARMKLTRSQARTFTHRPEYPSQGAE